MNDLTIFLLTLLPSSLADVPRAAGIVGGIVYAVIEVLDKLLEQFKLDLNSNVKLVLSIIGSIALPVVAVILLDNLGVAHPVPNVWFLVAAVAAWCVSQVAHGGFKANRLKKNAVEQV